MSVFPNISWHITFNIKSVKIFKWFCITNYLIGTTNHFVYIAQFKDIHHIVRVFLY